MLQLTGIIISLVLLARVHVQAENLAFLTFNRGGALYKATIPADGGIFAFTKVLDTGQSSQQISYDPVEKKIYWIERAPHMIGRCDLDGGNPERYDVANLPYGITLDYTNRIIYYSDLTSNGVSSLSIAGFTTAGSSTLVDGTVGSGLDQIGFGTETSSLYVAQSANAEVVRYNSGTPTTLFSTGQGDTIVLPSGIFVDEVAQQLFYSDFAGSMIRSYNLMDMTKTTIFSGPQTGSQTILPYGMSVYKDDIYFCDFNRDGIYKINKNGIGDPTLPTPVLVTIDGAAHFGDGRHGFTDIHFFIEQVGCVSNLVATTNSANQISLTWDAATSLCPADVYRITYEVINADQCSAIISPTSVTLPLDWQAENSATLLNLKAYTTYKIIVTGGVRDLADSSIITSGMNMEVQQDTIEDVPVASPDQVQIESMVRNTAVFLWSEIPCGSRAGDIQSYTFQVTSNEQVIFSGMTSKQFVVIDHEQLFDNLPCGSLTFGVAGNTAIGTGSDFGNVDYQLTSTGVSYVLGVTSTTGREGNDVVIPVDRAGSEEIQSGTATLSFSASGASPASIDDYSNSDQVLQFEASPPTTNNRKEAQVSITDDDCYEPDETFSVALVPNQCSVIGNPSMHEITIEDNDSEFSWSGTEHSITIKEGANPVEIEVVRVGTSQPKTVAFQTNHISSTDVDIKVEPTPHQVSFNMGVSSATERVSISAEEDNEIEGGESFSLVLRDPNGDACPGGNRRDPYILYVNIIDNDAMYNWKLSKVNVGETTGQVEVCLLRKGSTVPTTVDIRCDPASVNPAIVGVDFTPVSQIAFEEGDIEGCAVITIIPDAMPESTENLICTIQPNQDGVIVGTQNAMTICIEDDDEVVTVGWEKSTYTYDEGGVIAPPMIQKTGNTAVTMTITSTQSTATSPSDFTISPNLPSLSITIPAATSSYSLNQLAIINDSDNENTESFTLTISVMSSGTISIATATVSIRDNDEPVPTNAAPQSGGIGDEAYVAIAISSGIVVLTLFGATLFLLNLFGVVNLSGGAVGAAGAGTGDALQQMDYGYLNNGSYFVGSPQTSLGFGQYGNGLMY